MRHGGVAGNHDGQARRGLSRTAALIAGLAALLGVLWAPNALAAPGNPGVPGPAQVVFAEDFENVDDPSRAQFLDTYTGSAPLAMTYTAAPSWINASLCNGTIASYNSSANGTCSTSVFNTYSKAARPGARRRRRGRRGQPGDGRRHRRQRLRGGPSGDAADDDADPTTGH